MNVMSSRIPVSTDQLSAKATPVLDIRKLTVSLPAGADRDFAVQGVDLEIRQSEIHCVVGESGSGKSVSAQAVMGLLPQSLQVTGGEVIFNGANITNVTQKDRLAIRGAEISMIFQEPMTALNPVMKLGHQIDEVLLVHTSLSARQRRQRVLEAMREVSLPRPDDLYNSYPHQISGGQRQRIMIAAALVLEPKLLIADEPTTALDVTTQAQILKLIKRIQRDHGMAVMFITHDFGVVAEIADRVTVMCSGEMMESGPVNDVLKRPSHDYTRMLISAIPSARPNSSLDREETECLLEVEELSKTYRSGGFFRASKGVTALKSARFSVQSGQTLGIVGESGSGKSTLARCVINLIDPSSGKIAIRGQDISARTRADNTLLRQSAQIVFQDPNRSLNPRRTVGASIIEGPMNFGFPKTKALDRACELMELVGLSSESLSRYPHEFSGGQRQRICIARALAMKPKLLIADEAVSALDVSVQAQVLELLQSIQKKFGLGVLFITHDLRVAAQICHDLLVMKDGKIVERGPPDAVFSNPKHAYTKTLLDAAPGKGWNFGAFES